MGCSFTLTEIHCDSEIREGFLVGILRQLSWTNREDTDLVASCVNCGGIDGGLRCIRELARRSGPSAVDELERLLKQNGF